MSISSVAQSAQPGALISLFSLDTSPLGGGVFYFVQGTNGNQNIKFNGIQYTPVDIEIDGLESNGAGGLPTPRIRISNTSGLPQSIINTYGDLVGCQVTRIRTFERYLDDGDEPDGNTFYGPDIFRVEQKTSENPLMIEWELSAAVDQQGKMIPGRVVIRDTCLWRYRSHIAGALFDYSKVQCPYVGAQSFDKNDNPTTPDKDECGRRVSSCKKRFGANAALPFGGFPGVGRVRA